jgi:hypothetical protein
VETQIVLLLSASSSRLTLKILVVVVLNFVEEARF